MRVYRTAQERKEALSGERVVRMIESGRTAHPRFLLALRVYRMRLERTNSASQLVRLILNSAAK